MGARLVRIWTDTHGAGVEKAAAVVELNLPGRRETGEGGREVPVDAASLRVGDVFVTRPGETVATDGALIVAAARASRRSRSRMAGWSPSVRLFEAAAVLAGTTS